MATLEHSRITFLRFRRALYPSRGMHSPANGVDIPSLRAAVIAETTFPRSGTPAFLTGLQTSPVSDRRG